MDMDFSQRVNMDALDILDKFDIAEEEAYDVALEVNKRLNPELWERQRQLKATGRANLSENKLKNTTASYQAAKNLTQGKMSKNFWSDDDRRAAKNASRVDMTKDNTAWRGANAQGITPKGADYALSRKFGNLANSNSATGARHRGIGHVSQDAIRRDSDTLTKDINRENLVQDPSYQAKMHAQGRYSKMMRDAQAAYKAGRMSQKDYDATQKLYDKNYTKHSAGADDIRADSMLDARSAMVRTRRKARASANEAVMETALEIMHTYDISVEEAVDMAMSYVGVDNIDY